jgi:hypothetical protein
MVTEEDLIQALADHTGLDLIESQVILRGLKELAAGSETYLDGVINQIEYRRGQPPVEPPVSVEPY